jgi:hypothetical protein
MEKRERRGSIVGPVILIGLGVIFLLNNLGMLSWSVWETIFRLWPVILVAVGLDLVIGRRSVWGSLVALVLVALVIAAGLWLIGVGTTTSSAARTLDIKEALGGATEARVTLAPAVTALHVGALPASSQSLVEGKAELGRGENAGCEFSVSGGRARFTLNTEDGHSSWMFGGWNSQRRWDLDLNPNVPLDLEVSLAVGQATVDLTGLKVSDLTVSMAVGQTIVTLPAEGRFRANLSGAVGEIVVIVPRGMEARVKAGTAIVGRQMPAGWDRDDSVFTSPGYSTAKNRVDMEIGLAIGSVTVRESR